MGAYERRKGASFEREIVNELKPIFPRARRGLGQARDGGEIPDVNGTPFWIECKRGKSCSPQAAMAQARFATAQCEIKYGKPRKPPIAVLRRDGDTALVVMDLETFKKLAEHLPAHVIANESKL